MDGRVRKTPDMMEQRMMLLNLAGHDALHTSQLPDGNRTTDAAIVAKADVEQASYRDPGPLEHLAGAPITATNLRTRTTQPITDGTANDPFAQACRVRLLESGLDQHRNA